MFPLSACIVLVTVDLLASSACKSTPSTVLLIATYASFKNTATKKEQQIR